PMPSAATDAPPSADLRSIDLKAEAHEEAARLALVRRVGIRDTARRHSEPEGVWLAFARARRARAWLGRRLLVLGRVVCENGSDRAVESTLVSAAIELRDVSRVDLRTIG